MIDQNEIQDDVKILPPDYTLRQKIGNVNLDQILTPQAVEAAQKVIEDSSDKLWDETVAEAVNLEKAAQTLKASAGSEADVLPSLVASAFAIKAKAGMGGYTLVGTIAKSLQVFCEQAQESALSPRAVNIILWHVESIRRLMPLKLKGSGGPMGEEILAELEKIKLS